MSYETLLTAKVVGMVVGLVVSMAVVALLLAATKDGRYAAKATFLYLLGR